MIFHEEAFYCDPVDTADKQTEETISAQDIAVCNLLLMQQTLKEDKERLSLYEQASKFWSKYKSEEECSNLMQGLAFLRDGVRLDEFRLSEMLRSIGGSNIAIA